MRHYKIEIKPRIFHFKKPAGTSRGVYTSRKSWYIYLSSEEEPNRVGIGECAPLPHLSCDDMPDYEERLTSICKEIENSGIIDTEALRPYPSVTFGIETALQHYEAQSFALYNTPFSRGEDSITINGLIWMGSYKDMKEQIDKKLENNYRCVKLKIGAIEFEKELDLLHFIRSHYAPEKLQLRVDANGAFDTADALNKLTSLSKLGLHSIEQPIKAGQIERMAEIAKVSPLPIALDEELIGINTKEEKRELLECVKPQYIVLKPSLHGGILGTNEWIEEAERLNIGWWITSALESNIGLNAIAQYCGTLSNSLPQGLGTGQLFTDNYDVPLRLEGDKMWYLPK